MNVKVFNLSENDVKYQVFERDIDPLVNYPTQCHRVLEKVKS